MIAQLRSELVKLRSTRTNLGLLVGMIGLVLLIVIVTGLAVKTGELSKDEHQRALFGLGLAGGFVAALIGVMSICSEFRHGTIRPTFVFTPKRGRVLVAKVLSSTVLGAVFGLITEALAFGTGMAILRGRGVDTALGARELLLVVFGSVAVTALMAALGVGLGAVIRNQVLAVIGLVVWFMVVENVVVSVAPSIGRFFPLAAGDALTGINADELLTAPQGGAVLLAYVAAFFVAGLMITRRSDVK
jgi:ABC-type transport system involved in multi-copper enzyme maturation permease subunit